MWNCQNNIVIKRLFQKKKKICYKTEGVYSKVGNLSQDKKKLCTY